MMRGNLFVEFVGNKWYKYLLVPESIFEQFLKSSSKGNSPFDV
ncbi:MAG: KTSC domain-containing protein [Selenomonadaceae bacterium]|nr:KTSC domain-containing protein [Selenomonadaceae bacterium]